MAKTTASLVGILQTTPSPLARVDHATGDSFINDIKKSDDHDTVAEKVAVWYCNMVKGDIIYLFLVCWYTEYGCNGHCCLSLNIMGCLNEEYPTFCPIS